MTDTARTTVSALTFRSHRTPSLCRGVLREDVMQVPLCATAKSISARNKLLLTPCRKDSSETRRSGVERKIYISADMRARYGAVKPYWMA